MPRPFQTVLNPKVWWKGNRRLNDFIRAFVGEVWEKFFGPNIRYPLTTKKGRELADVGLVAWDYLLEHDPDALIRLLRINVNPYMAGRALALAFMGEDFAWVEIFGVDEIEPWTEDVHVMDPDMFGNDFIVAQNEYVQMPEFEDITELPDDEQEAAFFDFFDEVALPVTMFGEGSEIIDRTNIRFRGAAMFWDPNEGAFRGRFVYQAIPTHRLVNGHWRDLGPFRKLYQQVSWQDVPLPYHAWDVDLMDPPTE